MTLDRKKAVEPSVVRSSSVQNVQEYSKKSAQAADVNNWNKEYADDKVDISNYGDGYDLLFIVNVVFILDVTFSSFCTVNFLILIICYRVQSADRSFESASVSSESTVSSVAWNQSKPPTDGKMPDVIMSTECVTAASTNKGFFDGLWGCLRPMWSKFGKSNYNYPKLEG